MDHKKLRQQQKENKRNLEHAKNVLIDISKNTKNSKFEKLPLSDVYRAKMLQRDNKERTPLFKKYKRGTIIFADFGIGIGNEFSHPHFAIVLDNKDNPFKGTLTVVPLSSKKSKTSIDLGTDLITKLINTAIDESLKTKLMVDSLLELKDHIALKAGKVYYPSDPQVQETLDKFAQRNTKDTQTINIKQASLWMKNETQQTIELLNFYKSFYKNTFAKVENITTISKFKIMKPKNPLDPIGRVQISKNNLHKIEEAIIKNILKIKLTNEQ